MRCVVAPQRYVNATLDTMYIGLWLSRLGRLFKTRHRLASVIASIGPLQVGAVRSDRVISLSAFWHAAEYRSSNTGVQHRSDEVTVRLCILGLFISH